MTASNNRQSHGNGWNRMLSSAIYHRLYSVGLPGWDLGVGGHELSVRCAFVCGPGKQAVHIAVDIDDICTGQFYYRDHTITSLPFADIGDVYLSTFAFQLTCDYLMFIDKYKDHTQFGAAISLIEKYDMARMTEYLRYNVCEMFQPSVVFTDTPATQIAKLC